MVSVHLAAPVHLYQPTLPSLFPSFKGRHHYYAGSDFQPLCVPHGLDLPAFCALPSVPSASTHPTPEDIALSAVDVQRVRSTPLRRIRLRSFASRLAPASGRIEFLIVRTSHSLPVALHLCSRRRSYVPLPPGQRTGQRRTSTSLTWHPHGRTSGVSLKRRPPALQRSAATKIPIHDLALL